MARFLFYGRLTLTGVTFLVEAETPEAAQAQATQGQYVDYDTCTASAADWDIDVATLEENP